MPSYPHKFRPGDTVTIRAWDDMLSQYGSWDGLRIKTPYITFGYKYGTILRSLFQSQMGQAIL